MSTFRVHIIEAAMKYGLIVLPFHFAHCDKTVIIIYSTVDILKGFWHHANMRTHIGWLNYIFNSAELHWWHHSTEARGQLANYGSVLSIWDWLFGTAYYSKNEWPKSIGVEGMDHFPERYHELLGTAMLTDDEAIERYGSTEERDEAQREVARMPQPAECEVHARGGGVGTVGGTGSLDSLVRLMVVICHPSLLQRMAHEGWFEFTSYFNSER